MWTELLALLERPLARTWLCWLALSARGWGAPEGRSGVIKRGLGGIMWEVGGIRLITCVLLRGQHSKRSREKSEGSQ